MLSLEGFLNEVKSRLENKYKKEDGYKVELVPVKKAGDVELDAVIIRDKNVNITPTIYLNDYYEQYQEGMPISSLVDKISSLYEKTKLDESIDTSYFTDFDKVKDKIVCRLYGKDNNKNMIKEQPYKEVEDLIVTYSIDLESKDGSLSSVKISNNLMQKWDVSLEDLDRIAWENTKANNPAVVEDLFEVIKDSMLPSIMSDLEVSKDEAEEIFRNMNIDAGPRMICVSNKIKMFGAVSILDHVVQDEVKEALGEDFYVIPSSVHEVLCIGKSQVDDYRTLETMIQDVNTTQVRPEEVLSGKPYYVDVARHLLLKAETAEETLAKIKEQEKIKEIEKNQKIEEPILKM